MSGCARPVPQPQCLMELLVLHMRRSKSGRRWVMRLQRLASIDRCQSTTPSSSVRPFVADNRRFFGFTYSVDELLFANKMRSRRSRLVNLLPRLEAAAADAVAAVRAVLVRPRQAACYCLQHSTPIRVELGETRWHCSKGLCLKSGPFLSLDPAIAVSHRPTTSPNPKHTNPES